MTRLFLILLYFSLAASRLHAQSVNEKVRITLWFARLMADSSVPRRPVVFVLPTGDPTNPGLDSLLRLLHPAFQRAGLATTPVQRDPHGDTLLVTMSAPGFERDTTSGTLYNLFYAQRYRSPECVRNEIFAARLLCTVHSCHFYSASPVGGGEPIECRPRP